MYWIVPGSTRPSVDTAAAAAVVMLPSVALARVAAVVSSGRANLSLAMVGAHVDMVMKARELAAQAQKRTVDLHGARQTVLR